MDNPSINLNKRASLMRKCGNALRLVLALLCVGTLWFWITNVWVAIIIYWRAGGKSLPGYYVFYTVYPVMYLLFCLVSCTRLLRGRRLIVTGVIMHIALLAWIMVDIIQTAEVMRPTVGFAIFLAALWVLLCISRIKNETPAARQH